MNRKRIVSVLSLLLIAILLCLVTSGPISTDCSNSSIPRLNSLSHYEDEYQKIAKQLVLGTKVRDNKYYFKELITRTNGEYLIISCQNANFCVDVFMWAENVKGFEGIFRTGGDSYSGARLFNFKWHEGRVNGRTEIVADNVGYIFD